MGINNPEDRLNSSKLSVVVVSYNQKGTIRETIESILSQRCVRAIEVLACDDCSTDGTQDVISKLAEEYPGLVIPVLRKKNLGVVGNFFDGIVRSTGDIFMVCGGDDYWLPGKAEIEIEFLANNKEFGMVYGAARCINANGEELSPYKGREDNSFSALLARYDICASTIAGRTELLMRYVKEVNPVEKGWPMEDFPMALWFSLRSSVKYIDRYMTVYRVLDKSISHDNNFAKRLRFDSSVYSVKLYFEDMAGTTGTRKEKTLIAKNFAEWQLALLDGRKDLISKFRRLTWKGLRYFSLKDWIKFIVLSFVPNYYISKRLGSR